MEHSPAKELSPAPSAASKGFKGVIAKARLGRKEDVSSGSLTSTEDSSERNGLRNSVDSLIRNSTLSSTDDGQASGAGKLKAKLIPKRIKRKLEEKEEAERQLQADEEDARGRSVDDQTATSAGHSYPAINQSRSTLDEDEGNSLLTLESDTQPPGVIAPPLVSRNSHIGYLTSSSPLVKTTPAPEDLEGHPLESPDFHSPQYSKSNTLPINAANPSLSSNLATQHAATFDDRRSEKSLDTPDRSRSRGVSPGARIKDVFTVGSRKKGASPPKSPNREMMKPDSNGNGLAGYMKRKSNPRGKAGNGSDSMLSLETIPSKSVTSSRGDFPSIASPPQTPPQSAGLEAPETTVTPPTPTDARRLSQDLQNSPNAKSRPPGTNSNTVTSASGNMISHRRVRSDSAAHAPSKLSNAMSAPLTPMQEEVRPGSQGSPSGGFFSSVFSAAQNMTQNMTTQLTNTITNNPPRSRDLTQENIPEATAAGDGAIDVIDDAPIEEKKVRAVDTLGSGELSFSHLGIDTPVTASSTTGSFANGSEKGSSILVHQDEAAARAEDASAARAVSQAYSEKPVPEQATPIAHDTAPPLQPRSTYEPSIATGDKTPPNGSIYESENGFKRSNSVRSKVEAVARRHRNSSSATGGTIGAAIGASHAALVNPGAGGSTARATGFAVASKKRNRDYHQLFRSVPEDDYLIEDYSCALQRDIILAGRIYVSEGHICFSSNILGWVTTLVISFDEVVSVEKENTAVVFPNAIAIQTLHARHTFRSLLSREATYELLIGIWKLSHPSLKSSLNGVRLDNAGTGDKTEKVDPSASDETSDASDEEEEVYDEDDDEGDGIGSVTEGGDASLMGSEDVGEQSIKPATRKASAMGVAVGVAAGGVPTAADPKATEKAAIASAQSADFPGPQTHEPTECTDAASHYDKVLKDDIIPAPLGKVFSMVFGAASGGFMAKWLLDDIKVTDLQNMGDNDKNALTEQGQSRAYSYVKPLNAPIGPKTTKCLVTETLDYMDFERSISVTASTQTPDVPSGNIFVTKTRFCFMWAPGNQTRVLMNYAIEWSGKSWIKGAIESGATSGQAAHCNDLVKALKAGINARPRAGTSGSKPSKTTKGGKRRKGDSSTTKSIPSTKSPEPTKAAATSWGPLEPLHAILAPIGDILSPFISANVIIAFLFFIILFNYLRPGSSSSKSASGIGNYHLHPSPERIAAYEAMWQREEADLWDWLEERVGMRGGATYPAAEDEDASARAKKARLNSLKGKQGIWLREKVREMKMGAREVEEAIRITEERLGVLKAVVGEETRLKEGPGEGDVEGEKREL